MLHVLLVTGAPVTMTCLEGVLWTNDLAFEESRKSRVFRGKAFNKLANVTQHVRFLQTFDPKVAANERFGHVDSLDIHLHAVPLAL